MKIVLLRHGQRSAGYGDMDLSGDGHQQALALTQIPSLLDAQVLLSSPKKRTQQTLQPLSEKLSIPIQIDFDLDQRKSIESDAEFTRRVLTYMSEIHARYLDQTVILCSHSDWLQDALHNLLADHPQVVAIAFINCADYRVLYWKNNRWEIA